MAGSDDNVTELSPDPYSEDGLKARGLGGLSPEAKPVATEVSESKGGGKILLFVKRNQRSVDGWSR